MKRRERIYQLIEKAMQPSILMVENESNKHQVTKDGETHFICTVVTEKFKNMGYLCRHRTINKLVQGEFATGLHALSLHLYTELEWQARHGSQPNSPLCQKTVIRAYLTPRDP